MKYILNNPDKFDSYIFGSSRVGNIHGDQMWWEKVYNMTYSEATPKETLDNLKTFIKNGIYPHVIYLGVDSLSYTTDPSNHLNDPMSATYELSLEKPISFWKLYLDPATVYESYVTVISKHKSDDLAAYRFYEYGWNSDYFDPSNDQYKSHYDFNNVTPSIGTSYRLEETLDEIKQIKELCDEFGIELVLFTNPMHYITYEESLNHNYYEFLRGLAEITEFCNFSGYNGITTNNDNFIDNSHYNAEVSDMVKECITFRAYYEYLYEEGFGFWVNKDNIEYFIETLENTRNLYLN